MVQSYHPYVPDRVLGLVATPQGAIGGFRGARDAPSLDGHAVAALDFGSVPRRRRKESPSELVAVAAVEAVHVWNWRSGLLLARLGDPQVLAPVTCLATVAGADNTSATAESAAACRTAVGYADGSIRVFLVALGPSPGSSLLPESSVTDNTPLNCFGGADEQRGVRTALLSTIQAHRNAVTVVRWHPEGGSSLVSASTAGEIAAWDVAVDRGLFRLRDAHRGMITALEWLTATAAAASPVSSSLSTRHLVSASKDGTAKVWDLTLGYCVQTLVGHRGEVWALAYLPQLSLLLSGSGDQQLRGWRLASDARRPDDREEPLESVGAVGVESKSRVLGLEASADGRLLACRSADRYVEWYRVRSEKEARAHRTRRQRRARHSQAAMGQGDSAAEWPLDAVDFLYRCHRMRVGAKHTGMAFLSTLSMRLSPSLPRVYTIHVLSDNALMVFCTSMPALAKQARKKRAAAELTSEVEPGDVATAPATSELVAAVDEYGHRDEIRALAFSDAHQTVRPRRWAPAPLLLSLSTVARVWSSDTGQCLRSIPLQRLDADDAPAMTGTCAVFLPPPPTSLGAPLSEARYAVVGTRCGHLLVLDCHGGAVVDIYAAAEDDAVSAPMDAGVRAMALSPGGRMLVTGGSARCLRRWRVVHSGDGDDACRLTAEQTVPLSDEVTAVAFSPDGRLLLAALLDATVQVFRADTLQFHLCLYGHKLPVLCMDVSADSKLVVTGSVDKSCKVWGLDYGDCRRSFGRAHEDGVTVVRFVPGSDEEDENRSEHGFCSGGRDGCLRYWDADVGGESALVAYFEGVGVNGSGGWGHRSGRLTAMAVGAHGEVLASAGTDGSIRLWRRSRDQILAGEAHEERRRQLFDEAAVVEPDTEYLGELSESDGGRSEAEAPTSALAPTTLRTLDSVATADAVLEVLHRVEWASVTAERRVDLHDVSDLLRVLRRARGSHLESALRSLPFVAATQLLRLCSDWMHGQAQAMPASGVTFDHELLARCALLLLHEHFTVIGSGGDSGWFGRMQAERLRAACKRLFGAYRDCLGMNLAALSLLKRDTPWPDAVVSSAGRGT
eukprot:ctg_277.g108